MKAAARSDGLALSDLRIIDMATVVAGPAAAKYLGDFGAEVIKVEAPSGDSARRLGWAVDSDDDSFFWKIIGRNKKCVTLDLKSETGVKQMLKLVESADSVAARLLGAIGLSGDERFTTFRDRMDNQEALEDYVRSWVGKRTSSEVIAYLQGLDAAVAPLYTMRDVFADPHFRERQAVIEVDGVMMPNVIARFSLTPGKVRHAGRRQSADQDVLCE